ncbi:MAG: radical SAM protein [Candidatus Omnitrophota bacterium]
MTRTTRVMLINPSQEHFLNAQSGWTLGIKDVGYYQPLGLLYIATFLKKSQPDIELKVVDAASPDMPYAELRERIRAFAPDIVGIAAYTHTFIDSLKVSRIVKEIDLKTVVILGGHHLSYYPVETLHHESIDYIIIGEGELSFAEAVRNLKEGRRDFSAEGVFSRGQTSAAETYARQDRRFLRDISQLPFPDRSLVQEHSYKNILTADRKMTTIISSRGCPYHCTFCPQGREPYRQRTAADVVAEIEYCQKNGFTDFFFAEDTFNITKKKVTDFCDELKRRGTRASWCCKARVRGMDRETLAAMKEAGCYLINFGVETGTDEGLRYLHKDVTTEEIRQVFCWCNELKLRTMAYFMIGQPFERTEQDVEKNISFLLSLDSTYCNINTLNPTPFTPLFDEGVRKGFLKYEPWRKMVLTGEDFTPSNWEEHFPKDHLQRLRNKGLMRFYFRPRTIIRFLSGMRLSQLPSMASSAFQLALAYIKGLFA